MLIDTPHAFNTSNPPPTGGTSSQFVKGDGSLDTNVVPYTGATTDINLGTKKITAATARFGSSTNYWDFGTVVFLEGIYPALLPITSDGQNYGYIRGGLLLAAKAGSETTSILLNSSTGFTFWELSFNSTTGNLSIHSSSNNKKLDLLSDGLQTLGNVGIGNTSQTAKLDVSSDIIRLRTAKTPASAGAAGNAGDICWDADYVYVCVATNTWKRSALSTW